MTKDIDLNKAFYMEPEEIVKYFESKGLKMSFDWHEVYEEAHAKAFTVAKMMNADLLNDTKSLVGQAIKEGWSSNKFKKQANSLFYKNGWIGRKEMTNPKNGEKKIVELGTPRRIKKIFDCNMRSSYSVGRYKEQLEDADIAPYFQYKCVLDNRTREEHRALHDRIFRYDDPIWETLYPPNGWGCRCFVRSLTEREFERAGGKLEKSGKNLSSEFVTINKKGDKKEVATYTIVDNRGRAYKVKAAAGWSTNQALNAYKPELTKYGFEISKHYINSIVNNKPFALFYGKAVERATKALREVNLKDFTNNDNYTNAAVKKLKNVLSDAEKREFYYVALLKRHQRELLGVETPFVRLSAESFAKNIIRHSAIPLDVYCALPELISGKDLPCYKEANANKIICFANKNKYYKAVIKATEKELFLISLTEQSLQQVKNDCLKNGIEILGKTLKYKIID